jgi:hypothetical protein
MARLMDSTKKKLQLKWHPYLWMVVISLVVVLIAVLTYHALYSSTIYYRLDLWQFISENSMIWYVNEPTGLTTGLTYIPYVRENSIYVVNAVMFWVTFVILLGILVLGLIKKNSSQFGFVLLLDLMAVAYFIVEIVYAVYERQDYTLSSSGVKIFGLDPTSFATKVVMYSICLIGTVWMIVIHTQKMMNGDTPKSAPYVTVVTMLIAFIESYGTMSLLNILATPTWANFSLWVFTRVILFILASAAVVSASCDYDPALDKRIRIDSRFVATDESAIKG